MRTGAFVTLGLLGLSASAGAAVTMEKVSYGGWPNCIRLSNGRIEAIVTTDVGPRVIRLGFAGGQNLFKEYPEMIGKTGADEWFIYGGHRLWHAPEAKPRTYALDNTPVEHEWNGATLRVTQPAEPTTGIQKQIEITMDADKDHVRVLHRLINRNLWDIELAPWALSVMASGGRAIFPQEPYVSHEDKLLPARPLVLWNYTNMADPRWAWGQKYIQLSQDPKATNPQKIGILNTPGWAVYTLKKDVFIKRFTPQPDARHVDFNCNTETFTNAEMLEVETVGPLTVLAGDGGVVEHVENWFLFQADIGQKEADIDAKLLPLLRQTEGVE